MEKKKGTRTKKEFYEMLEEIVEVSVEGENKQEILDFLKHEKDLLNRKSNTKSKVQIENETLIEVVYQELALVERPVTVTELVKGSEVLASSMSTQRVTALLRKLKEAKRVVRVEDKKKVYYSVA